MTDQREPTLLERMGGVSGLVYASIPTFAYVIVNAIAGLTAAVLVAIAVSIGLIVVRRMRGEPIQPAVSGLLGVALAAGIAYFTGSADNYFLPGIWISLLAACAFTVSVLVRRPLVGVIWNLLRNSGPDPNWRANKAVVCGFDFATVGFVVLFAARFIVQQWLYDGGHTGWLAFARIAMGYPLLGLAVLGVVWAVRRANRLAPAPLPLTTLVRQEDVKKA